ncbi:urease isoform X1 [Tanacetum coccineum]
MGNGTSSHYLRLIRSSNDLSDTDMGRVVTVLDVWTNTTNFTYYFFINRRQVLPIVPHLIDYVQVEGTFPDGTKLITVHDRISSENGNLKLALHGSFLPIPSLEKFPIIEGDKIPGELILRKGHILLNSRREAIILKLTNDGDRPIKAYGMRLNVLGQPPDLRSDINLRDAKSVTLVRIGGTQVIRGDGSPLAYKTTREAYANIYGPTVGDKIRLGDTDLFAEVKNILIYRGHSRRREDCDWRHRLSCALLCPQLAYEAIASGITTMIGGETGPAEGTHATTCTHGYRAGAMGLKLHEDWGTTHAVIDNCLTVAVQYDIHVAFT